MQEKLARWLSPKCIEVINSQPNLSLGTSNRVGLFKVLYSLCNVLLGFFLKVYFTALQCFECIISVFHGRPFCMQSLNDMRGQCI